MTSTVRRTKWFTGLRGELTVDIAGTLIAMALALVLAHIASSLLDFDIGWRLPVATLAITAICGAIVIGPLVHANRRLHEMRAELQRLAHTDPLTGLPNRRAFFEQAGKMFAANRGTTLALAMIDIDHFKVINDSYGHDAGDAVLRCVAARIAACAESCGARQMVAARIGGEEFAIALAGLDDAGLTGLAKSLCDGSRETSCEHRGRRLAVTISVGVATRVADESVDAVLRAADVAVYAVKQRGRDGWHIAGRPIQLASARPAPRVRARAA
jgi:diguanylate cyclase (GGDEF)-like protein